MMFWLYMADVMSQIQVLMLLTLIIGGMVSSIAWFIQYEGTYEDEDKKKLFKLGKKLIGIFSILGVMVSIIPSQKTMYLMMGTKYIQDIKLKDIPLADKTVRLLEKKIDDLLKEDNK